MIMPNFVNFWRSRNKQKSLVIGSYGTKYQATLAKTSLNFLKYKSKTSLDRCLI
ncbi:hypothetical protein CANTEDRAFT_116478 [Yamadazyma tenuis ATCC 10573]|uniref:Uncharacterized protein n=1 Tax=Candida tenuis (strain ATCC 10573 / BCRC 21748 / CBS 615 / JCM 9827 / NBRC 10315 / NRRL Y-1498 / VKM Y-70) TaxID=590646 RepID=G3BE25_CANTC|nr:uncharacterized protein CANTEDRAFT_116478 [Yamadazyma tenuis ATCC 10573]EGV60439.1 hypothetical protein CANTEDRAFT_116478 [Yamadazyma tenuis ATCC 10573]